MANNISLTASMRSNLLSLQNISRQVSSTQNKLATGNTVNSAIDNPSSYYTARSLNNRANDLDALLDSMGQAVSTIKAATTALETGATFLEQAAAVATSALETNTIPAKSYFEEKVGENGAVVTTAQELKDAIAAGKETIVIYGKIDYDEHGIQLKANQKLVGTEYYTGYTGKERFSQLKLEGSIALYENAGISDLSITTSAEQTGNYYAIFSYGNNAISNITLDSSSILSQLGVFTAGIIAYSSNLELSGTVIIDNKSNVADVHGIYAYDNATINSRADIYANSIRAVRSALNFNSGILNLQGDDTISLSTENNSSLFIGSEVVANLSSNRVAFRLNSNSIATILGKVNLDSKQNTGILIKDATLTALSSAEFNIKAATNAFDISNGNLSLSVGTGLNIHDVAGDAYLTVGRYLNVSSSVTSADLKNNAAIKDNSASVKIDWDNWQPAKDAPQAAKSDEDNQQYAGILQQYDSIIKDSTYKGVNLLKDEKLNVRFNENGSADLNVNGKDMSASALGLSTVEWNNQGDIAQSLQEIANALKSIRAFSAELGNNYSIITNRQEFTENLINILTEGADKLTLADMNEESANMLSLQTRQQLAISSLSLASQASQSILKLF